MTVACIKSDCPVFGWNVNGSYFFLPENKILGVLVVLLQEEAVRNLLNSTYWDIFFFLHSTGNCFKFIKICPPLRFHQWSNFYNVSTVGLAQVMMPDPHTEQEVHFHCQYLSCTRPWKLIKFLKPINRNLSGCIRHQFYWNPNTL